MQNQETQNNQPRPQNLEVNQDQQPQNKQDSNQALSSQPQITTAPNHKSNKPLLVIIFILIFLLISALVILAHFYLSQRQAQNSELNPKSSSITQTQSQELDPSASEWQTYTDNLASFSIKYPENWTYSIINPTSKFNETDSTIFSGQIKFSNINDNDIIEITYGDGFGGGPCQEAFSGELETIILETFEFIVCKIAKDSQLDDDFKYIYIGSCGDCGKLKHPDKDNQTSFTISIQTNINNIENSDISKILSTFKFINKHDINSTFKSNPNIETDYVPNSWLVYDKDHGKDHYYFKYPHSPYTIEDWDESSGDICIQDGSWCKAKINNLLTALNGFEPYLSGSIRLWFKNNLSRNYPEQDFSQLEFEEINLNDKRYLKVKNWPNDPEFKNNSYLREGIYFGIQNNKVIYVDNLGIPEDDFIKILSTIEIQ